MGWGGPMNVDDLFIQPNNVLSTIVSETQSVDLVLTTLGKLLISMVNEMYEYQFS